MVTGTGTLTGIACQSASAATMARIGTAALVVGPALTVAAIALNSDAGFFGSSLIAGVGFGAGFQGGLRILLQLAPVDERAGLLSPVYVICYAAFGVPVIISGLIVPVAGLRTVITVYVAFIVVLSCAALLLQRRAEQRSDGGLTNPPAMG
jgi:hypothetical protein